MSNTTWFKFYPDDWLNDDFVSTLSLEEKGAYITLLLHQASKGPFEDPLAILNVPQADQVWSKLASKFQEEDGKLVNRKMAAAVAESASRQTQAKNAAATRWGISFGPTNTKSPELEAKIQEFWKMFPKREHQTLGKPVALEMLRKILSSTPDPSSQLKVAIDRYKAYLLKKFPSKEERQEYTKRMDNWLEDWADWYEEPCQEIQVPELPEPQHANLWAEAEWLRKNRKLVNYPPTKRFPWEKSGPMDFSYNEAKAKANWPDEILRDWLTKERAKKS